jgi:hypothetical protein
VDFRPIAPATVWVPSCSRLILIATGLRARPRDAAEKWMTDGGAG